MSQNTKPKYPQIKINNEASRSLIDAKDSSENDSSNNTTTKPLQIKSDARAVKPKVAQKSRVVASRYKTAAIEATRKNLSNSSDSSRTISPLDKRRIKQSSNLAAPSGSFKGSNYLRSGKGSSEKPNLRLHSTAVNSSIFLEKTQLSSPEEFSTTIVGGQNRFPSNKNEINSTHLPDLSEICPSASATIVSVPANHNANVDLQKKYSKEDLNKEYLEYLTWAHIDKKSEEVFDKQVKEAQKQISVLCQLLENEEEETSEMKQKLEILNRFEHSSHFHDLMKEELTKLNEMVDPCGNALKDLSFHLEFQKSQIKLENIYMPSNEENYKEELIESLKNSYDILKGLNSNVDNTRSIFQSAASVFNDVVDESEEMKTCLRVSEKIAALKIQESSLILSQK